MSLIPFLLLVVPVLEIAVFILVGGEIGVFPTLAMILVTAVLGSILLRIQGFAILREIQAKSETGELPGNAMINGIMILIAGVLLLTPGFVTDALGFLLFFPPFRQFLWNALASKVVIRTHAGFANRHHPHSPDNPEDNTVDLDPKEYSEKPTPDTPWKPLDKP